MSSQVARGFTDDALNESPSEKEGKYRYSILSKAPGGYPQ